jgi:hypothetical protein
MLQRNLTPLEARKRLLIAESEINRALLVRECQTLAGSVQAAFQPARILSALASSAITLIAASRGNRNRISETGSSVGFRLAAWLFRLGLTLWSRLHAKKAGVLKLRPHRENSTTVSDTFST